ncbi:MauE/DoxX family redox-associated membrane protein [Ilumatobacter sp.]|uniref:MauE/DoxX family redox-associated membrane protein n=1 Tax=Ilumatobacter sp. TaxID=1967498 RepID=UPI003AF9B9E7
MTEITTRPGSVAPTQTHATGTRAIHALLLPLRLFLAAGWLRAGVEKVIDPNWWTGDVLGAFLVEQRPHMLPFFRAFSDAFVAPLALPTAWLVVEVQIAIGLCLLLNRWPRRALWAGVVLNVCFTLAGRVNPSAFYLVMELVLLIGLSRPVNMTIAWRRAMLWCVPAAAMLPFARTLVPAEVIDDPAMMLSFVCGLAALATLAWSAAHLRFAVGWIDLLPRTSWSDAVRRRLQQFTTPSP